MPGISEILPGIITWSEFSEEKQLNFNGYFMRCGDDSVLIDPAQMDEETLQDLHVTVERFPDQELRGIYLTNVHHERMSRQLADQFGVPLWIHEKDKDLLETPPNRTFKDGDTLPCGLVVVGLQDQKSPGESCFYQADQKILFVGDALIGKVPGKVNQLPADKFKDIAKACAGLRVLLEYDFEALLLGDGEPIVTGGRQALSEFLDT
ncbi:MAG: hypothetical protein G3M78_04445 [Candidatus Nitrohelix vancouverensis]|uniref:Metallo-beta-lactamase domain-containing protein n=1 Tax=Candidatus Nitrohelix vancouverensis TaxID=2705534 RepID=A0A7T0C179_9BACT|nr:MAG: hypothetical protein G3M78_04445 [Candidatus Nitrohelix vancouverensis]